jgi:DNA-binding NarL/FixJ family response regulator
MTDPEDTDPPPALYRELLERQARLERLLERLLEHDRPRARSARPAHAIPTTMSGKQIRLTERQVQILCLLVMGRTNRQIGAQFQISPGTVGKRLTRIYRKLGVTTRTQAAVRVIELGLGSAGRA